VPLRFNNNLCDSVPSVRDMFLVKSEGNNVPYYVPSVKKTEKLKDQAMTLSPINLAIIEIANRYGIADLYVFGSRTSEIVAYLEGPLILQSQPESDVDFGVLPIKLDEWNPAKKVKLCIELEDLFQVDRIDLVLLPEADPYLALDIIRGELLYTRNPDQQARYELFVLRRAGDLIPFKKERNRMILQENAR